jgi:RNA polymerase sigma factor (sigma-70 family)
LDRERANVFVEEAWPVVLLSLEHYPYQSALTTWMYRVLSTYYQERASVKALQSLGPEYLDIIHNLIEIYFTPILSDDPDLNRLRESSQQAGILPEALNIIEYIIKSAIILFGEDPLELALAASENILKGVKGFYYGSQLTTWMNTVMRNSRKQILRRKHGETDSTPDSDDDQTPWLEPKPGGYEGEITEILNRAIYTACERMHSQVISVDTKKVVGLLYLVYGEDYETISELTQINIDTVRTIVFRIEQKLLEDPILRLYLPQLTLSLERLTIDGEHLLSPAQPAAVGETIKYQITLKNTGAIDADDLTLTNPIPAGAVYLDNSLITRGRSVKQAYFEEQTKTIYWKGVVRLEGMITIVYQVKMLPPKKSGSDVINKVTAKIRRKVYTNAELITRLL